MTNTKMMKAFIVEKPGNSDALQLKTVPIPSLKSGWSLIKIKGFGINRSEIFTRQGLSPSVSFPRVLGIECVGLIEQTTDSKRLPIGQKVVSIMGEMGRDFDGSYAEYVLVPNEQIYPLDTTLDWQTLATIPESYYTAYLALLNLQIKENDTVLVRGATSSVGVAFAQLLKAQFPHIHLTGSSRSVLKNDQMHSVGFDAVVLDRDDHLQTEVAYDKVLELIGPKTIQNSLQHTKENAIVCSAGQLGGEWFLQCFDPIMALRGNRYLTTAYSGDVSQEKIQSLFDYMKTYHVPVKPERVFHFHELPQAHECMETKNSFGKNIVLLEDNL